MNVLLIKHHAGSIRHGMEYRPYYLVREWGRLGHRLTIVASSESHVRTLAPPLGGAAQLAENIDGIDYLWLATPPYRSNDVARVRYMATFVMRLRERGAELAACIRPGAVTASRTYPLDIWSAHRIARMAGARLLFKLHDLWPLSPVAVGGYSRWHPFIMLLRAAENFACRRADAVVSILPKVREHLEAYAWHLYPVRVPPAARLGRDELSLRLSQRGIGTSVHFIPLDRRPVWRDACSLSPAQLPVADACYEWIQSLPLCTNMSDADQERVIAALHEVLA